MNKLSFEKVEELFLQKYPEGKIWVNNTDTKYNYKVSVSFNKNSKSYDYSVNNYLELLDRLELNNNNMMYKNTYDKLMQEKETLENQISQGGQERGFGKKRVFKAYTEEEMQLKKNSLNEIEEQLKDVTII